MFSFLAVAGLPVVACMPGATGAGTGKKEAPAKLEPDTEPGLSRVTLTEKAAQRLGIQMASVREEQIVRKRTVGGEVAALRPGAALPAAPRPGAIPGPGASTVGITDLSGLVVRVRLNESDLETVDRGQPARVLPIDRQSSTGVPVRPVEVAAGADPAGAGAALYYAPDGAGHGLAPGQRVFIELPLAGGGPRKVVPYTAVLYDLKGQAWLYTSPSPRVFVRRPIKVDFVERDLAVLLEGPSAGTEVVTVGAAELYGAESGVGKK